MSTVVPQAWIIQEKIRQEAERRRNESGDNWLPVSLPEYDEEYFDPEHPKKYESGSKESTVIIIDI